MSVTNEEMICSCSHTRAKHKYGKSCYENCDCIQFEYNSSITLDPSDNFDAALIKIKQIHDKKKADYSDPKDRFSNFVLSANFANITVPQTFEVLIGTKQARLIELTRPGRVAQNESIEDTLLDRAVYCILAYVYYLQSKK